MARRRLLMRPPARAAAVVALGSLALGGCSSTGSDGGSADGSAPPTDASSSSTSFEGSYDERGDEAPLRLLGGNGPRRSVSTCFRDDDRPDLAWFDISWRATEPISNLSVELVDADGVTMVGAGQSVPPARFGEEPILGGASTWRGRDDQLDSRLLRYDRAETLASTTARKGETGLLVIHLRPDDAVRDGRRDASLGGLRVRWQQDDGTTGTVEAEAPLTWGPPCR